MRWPDTSPRITRASSRETSGPCGSAVPATPGAAATEQREWIALETERAVYGALRATGAPWMNHPDAVARSRYKPWQLRVAREAGLLIPDTLFTTEPAAAEQFAADSSVIVKAVSGRDPEDPPVTPRSVGGEALHDVDAARLRAVLRDGVDLRGQPVPGAGGGGELVAPLRAQHADLAVEEDVDAGLAAREEELVEGVDGRGRLRVGVLADRAYSSRAIRARLRRRGIRAVIPQPADQIGHRLRRGRAGGRPPGFDAEKTAGTGVVTCVLGLALLVAR